MMVVYATRSPNDRSTSRTLASPSRQRTSMTSVSSEPSVGRTTSRGGLKPRTRNVGLSSMLGPRVSGIDQCKAINFDRGWQDNKARWKKHHPGSPLCPWKRGPTVKRVDRFSMECGDLSPLLISCCSNEENCGCNHNSVVTNSKAATSRTPY
jgi:hypothetical protein